MAAAHVPAWRKLGLKLKSEQAAGADRGAIVPTIETSPVTKRRKLSLPNGIGDQIRAQESSWQDSWQTGTSREANVSSADTSPLSRTANASILNDTSSGTGRSGRRSSLRRSSSYDDAGSPRKRKSVSFTPDTKLQDGGKVLKDIFINRDVESESLFESYASASASVSVATDAADKQNELVADTTSLNKAKKKKKKSKSKSKSTLTSESPNNQDDKAPHQDNQITTENNEQETNPRPDDNLGETDLPTAGPENAKLKYLTDYHSSRATWKFNKNKQNWLLANALDVEKIPPSYDQALSEYVRGLESEMARRRLFIGAKEMIAEDDAAVAKARQENAGPDPESVRISEYMDVMKKIRADVRDQKLQREERVFRGNKEYQKRVVLRKRAELLIWSCNPQEYMVRAEDPDIPTKLSKIEKSQIESIPPKQSNSQAQDSKGRRRKRKRRTGNADDDTSSSESSSGDNREWRKQIATVVAKGQALPKKMTKAERLAAEEVKRLHGAIIGSVNGVPITAKELLQRAEPANGPNRKTSPSTSTAGVTAPVATVEGATRARASVPAKAGSAISISSRESSSSEESDEDMS